MSTTGDKKKKKDDSSALHSGTIFLGLKHNNQLVISCVSTMYFWGQTNIIAIEDLLKLVACC